MKSANIVVEYLDANNEVAGEVFLQANDLPHVLRLLDIDGVDFERGRFQGTLDEAAALLANPAVDIIERRDSMDGESVRFRRPFELDDLPYRIHTHSELRLMLDGSKPLSAFHIHVQERELGLFPQSAFDAAVARGELVKRVVKVPEGDLIRVLYATTDQVWRIDAYLAVWRAHEICGWNDGLETMEGLLLGYSESQMKTFLQWKGRQARQL